MLVSLQANIALDAYGRPKTSPTKVKVVSGASASLVRVSVHSDRKILKHSEKEVCLLLHVVLLQRPVDEEVVFTNEMSDGRRDYAHYVLKSRVDTVKLHENEGVRKLYLPYAVNA